MDNSVVTIFSYAFHGLYAKAIFLAFLSAIFAFGWLVGHQMGVDEAVDRISAKLDQVQKTE